jgi:hypothetical protein
MFGGRKSTDVNHEEHEEHEGKKMKLLLPERLSLALFRVLRVLRG